jgi:TonB family protein
MRLMAASPVLIALCSLVAMRAETNARLIGAELPIYPQLAKMANIHGTIVIYVKTDSAGKVISAVAKGGPPLLVRAAVENVKTWRFSGPSEQTITYDFKVDGTAGRDDAFYRYGMIIFHPPNAVEIIAPPPVIDAKSPVR